MNKKSLFHLLFVLQFALVIEVLSAGTVSAQTKIAGQSYFGQNNYIEYIYGSLPIIIGAPHGGTLLPANMQDRNDTTCGMSVTTVTDLNTQKLVRSLDTSLTMLLGGHPHTVICRLSRKKVDVNRDISEAACGDTTAARSWNEYMNFMDTARRRVVADYGRGLFIDIHGHGHTIQRNEIGYLLTGNTLRQSDSFLNRPTIIDASSLRYLSSNNSLNLSHAELIRGARAFGTLLANAGYPSVPSMQDPDPFIGDPYFDGGYNTGRWTSRDSGTIDGFQIETNYTGLRDNGTNIRRFTDSLAVVIKKYLDCHFSIQTLALDPLFLQVNRGANNILLHWKGVQGAESYTIEKSKDGNTFSILGKLHAGAEIAFTYGLPDDHDQFSYYRVVCRLINGKKRYSNIASIVEKPLNRITIYPNPAKGICTVNHGKAGRTSFLKIITTTGEVLKSVPLNATAFKTSFDVSDIPPGLFNVVCYTGGALETVRLVKQ